ncbi:hypothetical protein EDC01DRAFT_679934 [Geopyxis carbonaria]|nr:hypothetical protein EDC01DRAFT_679934 [Geopyxis carbonaria]
MEDLGRQSTDSGFGGPPTTPPTAASRTPRTPGFVDPMLDSPTHQQSFGMSAVNTLNSFCTPRDRQFPTISVEGATKFSPRDGFGSAKSTRSTATAPILRSLGGTPETPQRSCPRTPNSPTANGAQRRVNTPNSTAAPIVRTLGTSPTATPPKRPSPPLNGTTESPESTHRSLPRNGISANGISNSPSSLGNGTPASLRSSPPRTCTGFKPFPSPLSQPPKRPGIPTFPRPRSPPFSPKHNRSPTLIPIPRSATEAYSSFESPKSGQPHGSLRVHKGRTLVEDRIPDSVASGSTVWRCCWCENNNPKELKVCMICNHPCCVKKDSERIKGCRAWITRKALYFDA